jgi:hypothetical protein
MIAAETQKREITRDDIMAMDKYAEYRKTHRQDRIAAKKARIMDVGPFATFYFESYETMWWQIHEMLNVEKGGEAQIADELAAYNPLVPKGNELVATVMFQIEDEGRRQRILGQLGGVEDTIVVKFGGETVRAVPEEDVERINDEGKTSSVHFVHFPMTADQAAKFRDPSLEVQVGFEHENYGHMAVMPAGVREALQKDLD